MAEKHRTPYIIPIFIAHQGCPHRCIFCNQHTISGNGMPQVDTSAGDVIREIELHLSRPRKYRAVQVAFYGGSFTGLSLARQKELLESVQPYLHSGEVDEIRISTRPDYVNADTPARLRRYGVSIVELGVQSMDDAILSRCHRGHTVKDVVQAFSILQDAGFLVGGQLMAGLPGDTGSLFLRTALRLAQLQPDMVRIYPALVIRQSGLAALYAAGGYKPLTLGRAIVLCARAKEIFDARHIRVIRIGLQPSDALAKEVMAGPYHPAFGELVAARCMYTRSKGILLANRGKKGRCVVAAADMSIFRGHRNANWYKLVQSGLLADKEVYYDKAAKRGEVRFEKETVEV